MNTSALLTLDEIAAFLAVSRDTVYRMAQRGKIPAVKVGNQWRFVKTEVTAWLNANHNASQVEPQKRVVNGR
jgi:excisionase family DNA binding protein